MKTDADATDTTENAAADAIDGEMKTAVIILNWNTADFLKQFLPGLLSSVAGCDGAEVIVADNASSDDSMNVMRELFPDVRTMIFERNLGFTGGYNAAISQTEAEYAVLINSDIEVTEGWLEPLIRHMDTHPECGACAPKLHSWQNRDMFEYAGAAGGYVDRFGYPFCRGRVMKHVDIDKGQYDEVRDVFWATGACLMVRRKTFLELGGLDERFFAHMEEIDLCWRMQLHGSKVSVVPESLVYHVGGGTLPASSPFKLYLNYRNNLWMLSGNLPKTFALHSMREGTEPHKAAAKGLAKAGRRIAVRKALDILSALVYLATLNLDGFRSVLKAHRDFAKGDIRASAQDIYAYLVNAGETGGLEGWYRKWIIPQSIIHGKNVSETIKDTDFYNLHKIQKT